MDRTPTDLPLSWHDDGTPIFERGDFIRQARPLPPSQEEPSVIYDELMLPEHRHLRPELRFNLIVLPASTGEMAQVAWLGRSAPDIKHGYRYPRLLQALDSSCTILLQRWTEPGKVTDFIKLSMQPLHLAAVPSNYEVILVNSSQHSPARFVEIQAKEEVRDTENLETLAGSGYLIKSDGGFLPNQNYDELPVPRIKPGLDGFRFLQARPLYMMLTSYPKGFDFIDPPRPEFFIGAV